MIIGPERYFIENVSLIKVSFKLSKVGEVSRRVLQVSRFAGETGHCALFQIDQRETDNFKVRNKVQ